MKSRKQIISNTIKELGIPVNLTGYGFVRDAVEKLISNPSLAHAMTKELYPVIAEQFDTTPSRVERCIRHAIEVGWERGNKLLRDEIFGYTVSECTGKPTNAEFLATVADYISLKIEVEE